VHSCHYDAASKVMEIDAGLRPEDPPGTGYSAIISGPRPATIDGAVLVADSEFTYQEQSDTEAANKLGFVLRFKPGIIRLSY
jgi:hypothetical protein